MGLATGDFSGPAPEHLRFDILKFEPELDMTLRTALAARFEAAAAHDLPVYVLDLSGVSYLDSTIIALFLSFRERMEARGASVRVLCTGRREHLERLFQITGLDRYFTIHANIEQALE